MPEADTYTMLDEALDESFPASDPLPVLPGTDDPVPHRLYYMPGSCALGVHIALEGAGAAFEAQRVNREDLKKPDYLAINPAGVVPALTIDGDTLTEASAITLAIARQFPDLGPGPQATEAEICRFERLVVFLGGTLHPHFWPWFAPQRYGAVTEMEKARVKESATALIAKDLAMLDEALGGGPYFVTERRSVVDAYFFPMGRWGYGLATPTGSFANLDRLMRRLYDDPQVRAVMDAQGLPPLFS